MWVNLDEAGLNDGKNDERYPRLGFRWARKLRTALLDRCPRMKQV